MIMKYAKYILAFVILLSAFCVNAQQIWLNYPVYVYMPKNSSVQALKLVSGVLTSQDKNDKLNKKKLASIIMQNHHSKKDYPEEFTGFHYNSSLIAILKIWESETTHDQISVQNFRQKTKNERFIDESIDSEIIRKVQII